MASFEQFKHPYPVNPDYEKRVAYFCMEYGIDQALKIYAGGLGYLAGSHMRSAYELRQNLIGIGILWKFGYYDQVRQPDKSMTAQFIEKQYSFLQDTGIVFTIKVDGHDVKVKAFYLPPSIFGTAPLFLLSTDLPENDWLAQSISHRLYDSNVSAKVAQYILLGLGGAKLLDIIGYDADIYHMNEAHALPAAFYLYDKQRDVAAVRNKLVFTTHTPVEAGNEKHDIRLLEQLSFFSNLSLEEVRQITGIDGHTFNQSLACLRLARLANGVSSIHGGVSREMWGTFNNICPITHITNAQNKKYWSDPIMDRELEAGEDDGLMRRKRWLKQRLFNLVADQTGKMFNPTTLTLVWARRFAAYKRADLITRDLERFERMVSNTEHPIQIIWAGKPYPTDYEAVSMFNGLVHLSKKYRNCAVLTGYELQLSKMLKQGSDVWLNTPRVPREASGTSGMTAAMNASVNCSTFDGWIPEFARHTENAFIVPKVDPTLPLHEQDQQDMDNMMRILEQEIIPMYYDRPKDWLKIVKTSMREVVPFFDSDRMAHQYYEKLYSANVEFISNVGQVAASSKN